MFCFIYNSAYAIIIFAKKFLLIRGHRERFSIENNEELNNLRAIRDEAIDALVPNIDRMDGVDIERKICIYMSAARITNSSKITA